MEMKFVREADFPPVRCSSKERRGVRAALCAQALNRVVGARRDRGSKTARCCTRPFRLSRSGGKLRPQAAFRSLATHIEVAISVLTGDPRNQVDRIWDTFWTGGISNPLEVIEQITYLLFLRRLDDPSVTSHLTG
jgi:hypothetical protein